MQGLLADNYISFTSGGTPIVIATATPNNLTFAGNSTTVLLSGATDPVNPHDVATKNYVDSHSSGITAGLALSKVGAVLNVNTDNTTIGINLSNDLTLLNTGVTAGSWGSSSQIPIFTVDLQGRLTMASQVAISGVSPVGSLLNAGDIWVGNATNTAVAVTMSGDATLNDTGVLTLASTGIAIGNYGSATQVGSFTVDAKGRLLAAANITIQGVSPVGSTLTTGDIWIGSVTNQASPATMSGDATLASTGVLTLSSTGVTFGTYGTGTQIPTYTVNAKGLLTASANIAISGITINTGISGTNFNIVGSPVVPGGTVTLNIPNASATATGLLTSADWTTFNSNLPSTLANSHIFVGNAFGQAIQVVMSGDATLNTLDT